MVSAQATAGETVTITITKPDNSIETAITSTLADKTYSVIKEYAVAGNYKAKAKIDADSRYDKLETEEKPFTVPLLPRTIVLDIGEAT